MEPNISDEMSTVFIGSLQDQEMIDTFRTARQAGIQLDKQSDSQTGRQTTEANLPTDRLIGRRI